MLDLSSGNCSVKNLAEYRRTQVNAGGDSAAIEHIMVGYGDALRGGFLLGIDSVAKLNVRTEGPPFVENGKTQIRVHIGPPGHSGSNESRLAAPQAACIHVIRPVNGRAKDFFFHAGKLDVGRVLDGDYVVIVTALEILVARHKSVE